MKYYVKSWVKKLPSLFIFLLGTNTLGGLATPLDGIRKRCARQILKVNGFTFFGDQKVLGIILFVRFACTIPHLWLHTAISNCFYQLAKNKDKPDFLIWSNMLVESPLRSLLHILNIDIEIVWNLDAVGHCFWQKLAGFLSKKLEEETIIKFT